MHSVNEAHLQLRKEQISMTSHSWTWCVSIRPKCSSDIPRTSDVSNSCIPSLLNHHNYLLIFSLVYVCDVNWLSWSDKYKLCSGFILYCIWIQEEDSCTHSGLVGRVWKSDRVIKRKQSKKGIKNIWWLMTWAPQDLFRMDADADTWIHWTESIFNLYTYSWLTSITSDFSSRKSKRKVKKKRNQKTAQLSYKS